MKGSSRARPQSGFGMVWALAVACGVLLACGSTSSPAADAGAPSEDAGDLADGGAPGDDAGDYVEIRIFHTADEHGWLQPWQEYGSTALHGGAANVGGWLTEQADFDAERDLLLSGGDNWTGPAISTWFQGEPTVAAFNLLGYRASVIGNHEFDFGRDALEARVAEAEFPFLAANLTYADSGEPVDFAEPWVMLSSQGVQVGVIGLAGIHTATSANPTLIADLELGSYADALADTIPAVRAAGADLVVVVAHECADVLGALLDSESLDVDVVFAAHCHAVGRSEANGIPVISSGARWGSFSVTSITYDTGEGDVLGSAVRFVDVAYDAGEPNPVTPDAEIATLVADWQAQADEALGDEVGYTSAGVANGSWAQANWVTDSWLWAFPGAELAVANFGSLRQSIPAGAFTVADLVGMLPFENSIYEVQITGAQLLENLEQAVTSCAPQGGCYPAVAGMSYSNLGGSVEVTLDGGEPFDSGATYRVLVPDFIYYGGDGYLFEGQDPSPYDTALNIREPVIQWTASLGTSAADPLEGYLDPTPRD